MARAPTQAARRNAEKLAARARRMRNLQAPAVATAAKIRADIDSAYDRRAEPGGRKWRKLKYRKEPPPTLQLTGESRASIKVTASRGNLRFYAMDRLYWHMEGIPANNVPARNPTPFRQDERTGAWVAKPGLLRSHNAAIKRWIEKGTV